MLNVFKKEQEPEFVCWSSAKFREKFTTDSQFNKLIERDDDYQLTPSVVVMYDFSNKPLEGKYQTVSFDLKQGIVVLKKSTKTLINDYAGRSVLDFDHSRGMHDKLELKQRQVLAQGCYSYFSLAGHSKQPVDWVALHQMTDFVSQNNKSSFISISGLIFQFEQDYQVVRHSLSESIAVNKLAWSLAAQTAEELGYTLRPKKHIIGSLATNWDYGRADLIESAGQATFTTARDEYEEIKVKRTIAIIMKEFGIKCPLKDTKRIVSRLDRWRFNWE